MQIKLILQERFCTKPRFENERFLELRSGLLKIEESLSREKKTSIKCQQQKFFFQDLQIATLFGFISAAPGFCHSRAYAHSCCLC